jgi:hypothetical protein
MGKQRKNIFYWSGITLTYLAFGLALLVNSHVLAIPVPTEETHNISQNQQDSDENTPFSDQQEDGSASLQASSVLEAVVNASVLPLDSQLFDFIFFEFPVVKGFVFFPPISPSVLPYWQNTFGHIIVINGP